MKLRFDVDPAACLRAGIVACPSPIVIDVDAAKIKLDVRNLIADRLIGNDVCQLWNSEKGTNKSVDAHGNPVRLVAEAPTFEGLMKAVLKDAQIVQARQTCHRAIALAGANSLVESQPVKFATAPRLKPSVRLPTSISAQSAIANSVSTQEAASAKKKPRKKRIPTRAPRAPRAAKKK